MSKSSFTTKLGQKKLAGVTKSRPVHVAGAVSNPVRKWGFDLAAIRAAYAAPAADEAEGEEGGTLEREDYLQSAYDFLLPEEVGEEEALGEEAAFGESRRHRRRGR